MSSRPAAHPPIVILGGHGNSAGPLSAGRALRAANAPVILVTEDPTTLATRSRCFSKVHVLEHWSGDAPALVAYLREVTIDYGHRPFVIPTCDAGAWLLMQHQALFEGVADRLAPEASLGLLVANKSEFARLAESLGLPVPRSFTPDDALTIADIAARAEFPVILKPSMPGHWEPAKVKGLSIGTKAVRADSPAELIELGRNVEAAGFAYLVQEFIPGPDEEHWDLQAFISKDGHYSAAFTSQKRRVTPIHTGAGCFVESKRVPDLAKIGIDALLALGFRGVANIDFKRHERTGQFHIIEINPRLAHWSIFAADCGVNLALLAYLEACGRALPVVQQRGKRFYIDMLKDLSAFVQYRREGLLTASEYLRSLPRPWSTTYQYWSLTDPLPFLVSTLNELRARLARRRHR